jgi:hypothetical protein
MDEDDAVYIYSGSSAGNDHLTNLPSNNENMNISVFTKYKYKPSTIKRKFGKTKRKRLFQKKSIKASLLQRQTSSKILPSLRR